MSADTDRSDPQQRLVAVVELLAERPFEPLGAADAAARLKCTRDQARRTLVNLELAGWAWRAEGASEWKLAPRVTQISERLRVAIGELHRAYLGPAR